MNRIEITPKEKAILVLAAKGYTSEAIAQELEISVYTINTILKQAYLRIGASNRAHAIAICLQQHLIDDWM